MAPNMSSQSWLATELMLHAAKKKEVAVTRMLRGSAEWWLATSRTAPEGPVRLVAICCLSDIHHHDLHTPSHASLHRAPMRTHMSAYPRAQVAAYLTARMRTRTFHQSTGAAAGVRSRGMCVCTCMRVRVDPLQHPTCACFASRH